MKLSQKRRSFVYAAVHREMTDLRLRLIGQGCHTASDKADVIIAQIEIPLFNSVVAAIEEASHD